VIEVMEAVETASKSGGMVEVHSDFPKIPLMKWAQNAELQFSGEPAAS